MSTFAGFLRKQKKAESTVITYQLRLRLWRAYLESQDKDLLDATAQDIRAYRQLLSDAGQDPRTINGKVSTITRYYEWQVDRGKLRDNPVPRSLRMAVTAKPIHALTREQLRMVRHWFDCQQPNLRAAWYTMAATGARVGEVAKLRRSDVTIEGGALYINIRDAKWGSDRKIPVLDPVAARILYEYWHDAKTRNKPLFRVSRRTLQTHATNFAQETGIPMHPHILRHTFATRLADQGVPTRQIQFMLGHKHLAMTAHYMQASEIDMGYITPTIMQSRGNGGATAPTRGPLLFEEDV